MSNTIKAIRRGIKAGVNSMQNPQPNHFQAGGKAIVCSHCGNDSFDYIGVAGISIAGYGIACSKCTLVEYFTSAPSRIE
jgi:hypothetical protein